MTEVDAMEAPVRAALEALGVEHAWLPCDPDLADTAAYCEHYGWSLERSANAILVASKKPPGKHAVCIVLATSRLDVNRTVRRRMGVKRVSFASAELTERLTGMLVGGVTPFGLPEGLPVWVDSRVMERDQVIIGGGSRAAKIRLDPRELLKCPRVEVVEGLARLNV